MDEGKIINIINKEILYPEVLLNENNELISLNGYTNIKEYDHFIYELQTNMEKEVNKNIKLS